MALLREIRLRARFIAPPVLGACVMAYFAYHTVQGDRGLLTWLHLQNELAEAKVTRGALETQRFRLERRVALLRPDRLDRDILEERARMLLNYGHVDDLVILLPPPEAEAR